MNYFLGLDLSLTRSGYCIINQDGKQVLGGVITTEASGQEIENRFRRYRYIAEQILSEIRTFSKGKKHIQGVAIEAASFGSIGSRKNQLIESSAVVTNTLLDFFYREENTKKATTLWIEVAPQSLKKFILGKLKSKGKEAKNIMCREVYIKYGATIDDDNEVDAFLLAQVSLVYWKRVNEKDYDGDIFKYQYEVVDNIIKKRMKDIKAF